MIIPGGFHTLTPTQLCNVLWTFQERRISNQAFRVAFALEAQQAIGCALRRLRPQRRSPLSNAPELLSRLSGIPRDRVATALRQLDRAGVLAGPGLRKTPIPGSEALLEVLRCRRSARRPIPVPRRILMFLAQLSALALSQVMIGYLLRGLSRHPRTGEMGHRGTVKASWLARHLGLSLRSVRLARASLINQGWISADTQSIQRKLNRDGAYFTIRLDWKPNPVRTSQESRPMSPPAPTQNRHLDRESAPLQPNRPPDFAPPKEDLRTSIEKDQNQRTHPTAPLPEPSPGVFKSKPNLNAVQLEDLRNFGRMEILFRQAVQRYGLAPVEAEVLNFIAAAVRAREIGRDPARVFVWMVRHRKWDHITQAQEDYARRALARYRQADSDRFPPEPKKGVGEIN